MKYNRYIDGHFLTYPFYKDIVIPFFDHILSLSDDQFKYITGKYTKYTELSSDLAYELIDELGYSYISDAITLNATDIRIIFGYLKLFHLLKGKKEGLRFVTSLLGYDYVEQEWYEGFTRSQLMTYGSLNLVTDPYTFRVDINILLEEVNFDKLRKYKKFTRNYVYDLLKLFINISFELVDMLILNTTFIDTTLSTNLFNSQNYLTSNTFINGSITNFVSVLDLTGYITESP